MRHVFGIPGKESVRLGVELQRRGIEFISARHETQAVMMADGHWRACGRLGVALLAQGAGLANGIGGMACAARARSGVLVVTGDLLKASGRGDRDARAIQELKGVDPEVIARGIKIEYVRPASVETALGEVRRSIALAAGGRAVYLCIPSDLISAEVGLASSRTADPGDTAHVAVDHEQIHAVVELLASGWAAQRPVILAGRGAVRAGALPALRELGQRIGALLATTLPARSGFRGDPYDIGVCGTFATPLASGLLARADSVIALGASLNPFTTYGGTLIPKRAQLVQVDIDPGSFGKYTEPALAVRGDARAFAEAVIRELAARGHRSTGFRTEDVRRAIAEPDPRRSFSDESADGLIDPRTLMLELDALLPRPRAIVVDAGLHLHYACEFLQVDRPEDFIFPIDSLAVGLGLGAAIGAAVACPERTTVLEVGDGGLLMSLGDLETAARLRLPLVVVISNDQGWGAEAQHLRSLGLPDSYVRMPTPSLADVAKAMGTDAYTVRGPADLRGLAPVLGARPPRPIVLDCRVDPRIQPASFNFDYAGVFAR